MSAVRQSGEQLWLFDAKEEQQPVKLSTVESVQAGFSAPLAPLVSPLVPLSSSTPQVGLEEVAERLGGYKLVDKQMAAEQMTGGVEDSGVGQLASANVVSEPSRRERSAVLDQLVKQIRLVETGGRAAPETARISAGCEALNRVLPGGGYLPGSLVEWIRPCMGSGATYLALQGAREAMGPSKHLVVVDSKRSFYPPAAAAMGVDLTRVVIVYPQTLSDTIWALDQSLRCPAVGAVWGEVPALDDQSARRLQLAAEQGGGLGLLIRDSRSRGGPSWAEVQWWVQPQASGRATGKESAVQEKSSQAWRRAGNRSLAVQLTRCRGGRAGVWVGLEIDAMRGQLREVPYYESQRSSGAERTIQRGNSTAGSLHLAAKLAMPTRASRRDRAAS